MGALALAINEVIQALMDRVNCASMVEEENLVISLAYTNATPPR